jgi:hypothetical protein
MSNMKRQFEEDHPEIFEGDADSGNGPVCDEVVGRLFFAGDDAELNDALDAYLTRTPPHPTEEE